MTFSVDQLFVWLKHVLVGWFPADWAAGVSMVISSGTIVAVFATLFALTVLLERKGLGRIQNRLGPNRVGPYGILQPAADGLKMLIKEDIVPEKADKMVHFLAPIVMLAPILLSYTVLPFGRDMQALDLDAGVLFFFAVGSSAEVAVFMAGWSSRNKYTLLGALRGIAQMISYEMPIVLSTIVVVMMSGTLSLTDIVKGQETALWGPLRLWHVFTPWGLLGFVLFLIAATAESNRSPFDLPEGESEIIAGHMIEYSGFKYAIFFIGEYFGMFAISSLGITLFLGGYTAPFPFLDWVPTWLWFFLKLLALTVFFIWVRGTMPRLRMDQLLGFAWKFMMPLAVFNIVVAGVWFHTATLLPAVARWGLCAAMIAAALFALGRAAAGRRYPKRVYRYAS